MQVITLKSETLQELENQVNSYLKMLSNQDIKQVNYCAVHTGQVFLNTDKSAIGTMNIEYSAMIVFQSLDKVENNGKI